MESAVRSGVSAADAALGALGRPRPRRLFEFEEAAHRIVPGVNPQAPGSNTGGDRRPTARWGPVKVDQHGTAGPRTSGTATRGETVPTVPQAGRPLGGPRWT
ncbi:hypothetical protein SALBM311S_04274 [Streptomyces alboniger]